MIGAIASRGGNLRKKIIRAVESSIVASPLCRNFASGSGAPGAGSHWAVVVIHKPRKEIWHLCSLHGPDKRLSRFPDARELCATFMGLIESETTLIQDQELRAKCRSFAKSINAAFGELAPKQPGLSACGACARWLLEAIEQQRAPHSQKHTPSTLRASLLTALLMNSRKEIETAQADENSKCDDSDCELLEL